MSRPEAQIRFEEKGNELTAIEIVRNRRSPSIIKLYRVLLGLGIVVASYHARPMTRVLSERMVLRRTDGGAIDAKLSAMTKAAILPVVLEDDGLEPA